VSPSRYGDPDPEPGADELPAQPKPHDPRCRRGWLNRNGDQPVPCLVCKPHLAPGLRVQRIGE
jgi:hypothetical protein